MQALGPRHSRPTTAIYAHLDDVALCDAGAQTPRLRRPRQELTAPGSAGALTVGQGPPVCGEVDNIFLCQ